MSTRIVWIMPAKCIVNQEKEVLLDLTLCAKRFISNKVWERGYEYAAPEHLQSISLEDISEVTLQITPTDESGIGITDVSKDVSSICGHAADEKYLHDAKLVTYYNSVALSVEFAFDIDDVNKPITDDEFLPIIYSYSKHIHLLREINAFCMTALTMCFSAHKLLIDNSYMADESGGLIYVESKGKRQFSIEKTPCFIFPSAILTSHLKALEKFLDKLSSIWHLPLYPLDRYIRVHTNGSPKPDDIANLFFALDSLFPQNTPNKYIYFCCATLLGRNVDEAKKIAEIVRCASNIRNSIVHEGKRYSHFDKVKFSGQKVLFQNLFWEFRDAVANLLLRAIDEMEFDNSRTLTIRDDIVYKKIFND